MSSDSYKDQETLARLLVSMTDCQIGSRYGVTSQTIRYWRIKHQLPRSNAPRLHKGNVKYSTDRSFFSTIDTAEKAYILGFIVADGCVHRNGKVVSIAVKQSDADILCQIAAATSCDAPLHQKVNRHGYGPIERIMLVLNLSGRQLTNDLNDLGVHHDKSYTATYPSIPAELESHLVRGLFDGDGWIGRHQFSLVGTDAVVLGVADAIWRHTGTEMRLDRKAGKFLYVRGSARDNVAMHWMYANAPIALGRKAMAYQLHWGHRTPGKALPRGRSARSPVQSL